MSNTALWCICEKSTLFTQNGSLPCCSREELPFPVGETITIAEENGLPVFLASPVGDHPQFTSFRSMLPVDDRRYYLSSRALSLNNMLTNHTFCSHCGHKCTLARKEIAMQCPNCHALTYPPISPCVIVAIHRDDKLLLARHASHTNRLATVLAGFLEAGETLEQCVQREIFEEVSLRVKNIRYFASQSWSFPSQLMTAFTCDYASGEIAVDNVEILEADWFSCANMPEIIPMHGTVARRLIENFISSSTNRVP